MSDNRSFYGLVRVTDTPLDSNSSQHWVPTYNPEDTMKSDDDYIFATSPQDAENKLIERFPTPDIPGWNLKRVFRDFNSGECGVLVYPRAEPGYGAPPALDTIQQYLAGDPENNRIEVASYYDRLMHSQEYIDSNLVVSSETGLLRYDHARAKARRTRKKTIKNKCELANKESAETGRKHKEQSELLDRLHQVLNSILNRTEPFSICSYYGYSWDNVAKTIRLVQIVLDYGGGKNAHLRDSEFVTACRNIYQASINKKSAVYDNLKTAEGSTKEILITAIAAAKSIVFKSDRLRRREAKKAQKEVVINDQEVKEEEARI